MAINNTETFALNSFKKDAEKIIDALEDFYKIRSERGCEESFSAFGHALLTDMLDGMKTRVKN